MKLIKVTKRRRIKREHKMLFIIHFMRLVEKLLRASNSIWLNKNVNEKYKIKSSKI